MFNLMVEHQTAVLDDTYASLSHAVRREMLERLSERPHRVTEIAAPFDISLAAASKHVRVLERAGLVERAIHGRDHVLSMRAQPLEAAAGWIDPYRRFWEMKLDALEEHFRRKR
jgi:DNA-binding transcriptional ArsR family regulator